MRLLLSALCAFMAPCSLAVAADLPVRSAAPAPAPAIAAMNWSGFQVGVHAGWGFVSADLQNTTINNFSWSTPIDGGFAGFRVGYDRQFGSLVAGVSAEFNVANFDGLELPLTAGQSDFASYSARRFGSVDARLGMAFDRALIYAIGGFAMGNLSHTIVSPGFGFFPFGSRNYNGWNIGAGVDYALSPNLILRLEYRHYEFGEETYPAPNPGIAVHQVKLAADTVRFGLAYKFGGGTAPVVARY